jgi:membrane-bound serine protease (ClpP class)
MRLLPVLTAALALPLAAAPRVIAVNVDGIIHPVTVEIIGRALDLAARENAAAVLLRLNTPGGMVESTREITSKIIGELEAGRVPWVQPWGTAAAKALHELGHYAEVRIMPHGATNAR